MKLTKKYKADLDKAMRCAETGSAYHWETIADILASEIKRLRIELQETKDLHTAHLNRESDDLKILRGSVTEKMLSGKIVIGCEI